MAPSPYDLSCWCDIITLTQQQLRLNSLHAIITPHFLVESVTLCGGELSETVDTFGIMLNEMQMGSETACHWAINNEQVQTIELKIFQLHLPDDETCTSAFIGVS